MTTIHVIDSDPALRLAVRRALERAGYTVTDAAKEGATPSRPNVVIADLSAVSLAAIRRLHPASRVLAISRQGLALAGRGRIVGRLATPFTPSQLLTAVRLSLARPGATTEWRRR